LKSTEIGPNFACFWPLKIFWGGSPKILDRDYKIERSTEHHAKFRADRPTELGDYAARKKRKKINHSKTEVLPKTIVFRQTKNIFDCCTQSAYNSSKFFLLTSLADCLYLQSSTFKFVSPPLFKV